LKQIPDEYQFTQLIKPYINEPVHLSSPSDYTDSICIRPKELLSLLFGNSQSQRIVV